MTDRRLTGLTPVPLPKAEGLMAADRQRLPLAPQPAPTPGPRAKPSGQNFHDGKPARRRSVKLQVELVARANTAVDLARVKGIYFTLDDLVNGAIARELERLQHEINGGAPFGAIYRTSRGRQPEAA